MCIYVYRYIFIYIHIYIYIYIYVHVYTRCMLPLLCLPQPASPAYVYVYNCVYCSFDHTGNLHYKALYSCMYVILLPKKKEVVEHGIYAKKCTCVKCICCVVRCMCLCNMQEMHVWRVAVCCSVLQCVAVCCSVLQCAVYVQKDALCQVHLLCSDMHVV